MGRVKPYDSISMLTLDAVSIVAEIGQKVPCGHGYPTRWPRSAVAGDLYSGVCFPFSLWPISVSIALGRAAVLSPELGQGEALTIILHPHNCPSCLWRFGQSHRFLFFFESASIYTISWNLGAYSQKRLCENFLEMAPNKIGLLVWVSNVLSWAGGVESWNPKTCT